MTASVCRTWLLAAAMAFGQAPAAMWIDVPFVAQPREGCGAASLAMVMQYWAGKQGVHASPESDVLRIQRELYSRREHGISAQMMGSYLRRHGFQTIAFTAGWKDLEEQIAKGRPLIVAIRPEGQSELHYVVIAGIDSSLGLVSLNDPAERKLLREDRARFEREWSAERNWALLAVPAPAAH